MEGVAIGICTYNRAKLLPQTIDQLFQFSDRKSRIVVANDGSTDNTKAVIKKFGLECITGPNGGPGRNKNRLFKVLRNYKHIFIIEDDLFLLRKGWEKFFISAYEVSGIHHFTFSPPGPYGKCLNESKFGDVIIQHPQFDGGAFAYYSKEVLEKCGGFCKEFKGYGWEHCEFSERIHRAGLVGKYKNNHVLGSKLYMKLARTDPVVPTKDRERDQERNHKIWDRSRMERWINCPLE